MNPYRPNPHDADSFDTAKYEAWERIKTMRIASDLRDEVLEDIIDACFETESIETDQDMIDDAVEQAAGELNIEHDKELEELRADHVRQLEVVREALEPFAHAISVIDDAIDDATGVKAATEPAA